VSQLRTLAPDLESGNMLAKQLEYLAEAQGAGIVLGARVPIALTSRADKPLSRMVSCALALLVGAPAQPYLGLSDRTDSRHLVCSSQTHASSPRFTDWLTKSSRFRPDHPKRCVGRRG
jgi:hypothetical protein